MKTPDWHRVCEWIAAAAEIVEATQAPGDELREWIAGYLNHTHDLVRHPFDTDDRPPPRAPRAPRAAQPSPLPGHRPAALQRDAGW